MLSDICERNQCFPEGGENTVEYNAGKLDLVCSMFLPLSLSFFFFYNFHSRLFASTPPPFQTSSPSLPPFPLLLPLRISLAEGDRSAAALVCYCPHGNHPPISFIPAHSSEAHACGLTRRHTHTSCAIQSLAQAELVCSTCPSEWYSPCPAPISELLTRGVHVSLMGVVAISEACYWLELMASLPVQSLSRHLPCWPVTSALCGLQWPNVTQGCCSHATKHRRGQKGADT